MKYVLLHVSGVSSFKIFVHLRKINASIDIHYMQNCQAMLEGRVCEYVHTSFIE